MRLKNVWNVVPIPAKLKLFAERITLSKLTIIYFVFSLLHCVLQLVFQIEAFKINETAANFLNSVIVQGNVSEAGFTVWEGNVLRWCTTVPQSWDVSECQVVWNGTQAVGNAAAFLNNGQTPQPAVEYSTNIPSESLSASSILPSPASSLAPLPSSIVSSSVLPTFSPRPSGSPSPSSQTATTTVRTTVTNIAQLQNALQSLEAGDLAIPESAGAQTVTVTIRPVPTATGEVEVVHAHDLHKKRSISGAAKVISTLAINGTREIKVSGIPGRPNEEVTLSESCLVALNYPLTRVDNTKREDIVFIAFSFWVLGMSLVALLNESPPHIVASFLTHCLATGWSGFQIVHTQTFRQDFTRLATRGACNGVNLLPTYWTQRQQFEIPTLAFNALALLISAVSSWKLMKSFGWQTFKRIGASLTVSRAYRIILILSIVIQLSVFFVSVSVALWVDQVYNGDIGHLTKRATMFKVIMIAILFALLPWLTIGWISVRREQKIPMLIFLVLSFGYTVGWSSMFASPTFRWTFVEWTFFSIMATASVILALATFILGIICRCNFGKGLTRYLNAQQELPGDDFEPAYPPSSSDSYIAEKQWGSDEEKIDFPSYNTSVPIPTYAQVPMPPPAHVQNAPRVLGPRFYQANGSNPFDQRAPQEVKVNLPLTRHGSGSSQHSIGSMRSISSDSSSSTMRGKRWVIE